MEQHKDKPSYPLFSAGSTNVKRAVKEKKKERASHMTKENSHDRKIPPTMLIDSVPGGPSRALSDPIPIGETTSIQALHLPPPIPDPIIALENVSVVSSMEVMLGHILEEQCAIKISQEEVRKETNEQLSQLNANLIHLSTWVFQAEQRVSDLEGAKKRQVSTTSQIQSELEELQFKLDEVKNRS
ncbi:hypothetical protein NDU88_004318 [Pleurodeles waltl]|uniref:Uncharacterized protein n=1 Tax=Pleurodeles waltl TaxID=8319 RepID=A0AAV7LHP9_PLEWA|nr:hypothetical protein NDU88_004318 [Pleurodeles waltl]